MAKPKVKFVCQQCGFAHPKWVGQCQSCGEWNTLSEEITLISQANRAVSQATLPQAVILKSGGRSSLGLQRQRSTIKELDRVLGGGIVPGAVILLSGSPGIGKSTLMTQLLLGLNKESTQNGQNGRPVLYIAGEESPEQISLRIKRISQNEHKKNPRKSTKKVDLLEEVYFLTTTDVDQIILYAKQVQARLIIVDSIQTLNTQDLTGAAGSIGQVRETTERLTTLAKATATPIFLVGHITKEGRLAGPMTLEHIVDTVLALSGEQTDEIRLLRASKNRFGATDEVGVFKMTETGFMSVDNPSELFTSQTDQLAPGSVITCVIEGTRPLLVEVQALLVPSKLAMARRVGRGIELSRIQVISAVLQKHCGLATADYDIFVSIAGGYQTKEPGLDLAVAVAMASSIKDKPIMQKVVLVGEVGLLGEIRGVRLFDRRRKEARRLGYRKILSSNSHQKLLAVLQDLELV